MKDQFWYDNWIQDWIYVQRLLTLTLGLGKYEFRNLGHLLIEEFMNTWKRNIMQN